VLAYVDTSALIALAAASDRNHARALDFLRTALADGVRFVIGRPVLIEYIDGVTKRVGKTEAIQHLRSIESSAVMRVEPDIDEDHRVARTLFFRYDDQPIDLTDCLSFAIADRLRLEEAFTFDSDFATHRLTCRP
jgi:predicted nucleic acid-binding protein